MRNLFDRLLLARMERYPTSRSLLDRIIRCLGVHRFRKLYQSFENGKELADLYWGRAGGFEHAKAQFNRPEAEWQPRYGGFADMVLKTVRPGQRIFEIGCGAGQWAKRLNLAGFSCHYVGIDVNAKSIDFARNYFSNSPHLEFRVQNVVDADDIAGFDVVLSCQTLFFISRSTIIWLLDRMKTGSIIVLQEPANVKMAGEQSKNLCGADVGFSHDYACLLRDSSFQMNFNEVIAGDSGKAARVLIRALKAELSKSHVRTEHS